MKEKIFWCGVVMIVLSLLGNYAYLQTKQLDQPIFLDHYYESYQQNDTYLKFYYLTNKYDSSDISHVVIDGIVVSPFSDYGFWMAPSNVPHYEQDFAHHLLKSLSIRLPLGSLPNKLGSEDKWSFDEMTVHFTNGETMTTKIGQVNVYGKYPGERIFDHKSSYGNNQGRQGASMVALKTSTIEIIVMPFSAEIGDDMEVKIHIDQKSSNFDGEVKFEWDKLGGVKIVEDIIEWDKLEGVGVSEDIYPLHLDQGEWLHFSTQFNPYQRNSLAFALKIVGITDDGVRFNEMYHINTRPYLTQETVNEIIKEKQGGRKQ